MRVALAAALALATPFIAEAQARKLATIGELSLQGASFIGPRSSFMNALRDFGWIEGQNLSVERRSAASPEQLPGIAEDLVRLNVDVVVVASAGLARVAQQATKTIPIVTLSAGELEGTGLIASLARPGGNVTGMQIMNPELMSKRIELLKLLIPNLSRLAVLEPAAPTAFITANYFRVISEAARQLGVRVQRVPVRAISDFEPAFAAIARDGNDAVLVIANPLATAGRKEIVSLGAKRRLPIMYENEGGPLAGGLVSYGAVISDMHRRGARYVDRLLKGAKAAELPVEQASVFELIINTKAAREIGLTIPPSLLLRADQVIDR
jgi:putative ABC transport system substrate-binding protein